MSYLAEVLQMCNPNDCSLGMFNKVRGDTEKVKEQLWVDTDLYAISLDLSLLEKGSVGLFVYLLETYRRSEVQELPTLLY